MTARILVVEDNAVNLKLIRDVLNFLGYQVTVAHSGEEGVELARTGGPDLVLMDLQLPGIDGTEALRQLRTDPKIRHVPVVAVTASAMKHDREQAARDGFDGYLGKPLDIAALPDQIHSFLARGGGRAG